MPLTSFAGGSLFGVSYGTAKPWLLALHGWQRSHQDFDTMLSGQEAVAVDLAGFGVAPPPPAAWSTSDYGRWIFPVLEEMSERPVILGHSFGGRVALRLAQQFPDQVGALVLSGVPLVVDPDQSRPAPALAFRAARRLNRAGIVSEAAMTRLRRRYGSADYLAAQGVMRGVLVAAVNETYEDALSSFAGPIELVWGAQDDQAPLRVAELGLRLCRHGRLTTLEGVGHFTPLRAPEALMSAALAHRPA
jgi:pimeloyl-ACP methyl ester carboxylesterase